MDLYDRRTLIDQELTHASGNKEQITFRNQPVDLPVIRLPINVPIYRMENGRTTVDQAQYVNQLNLPGDYFRKGEENETAQSSQQEILLKLSQDPKAPVFDELEALRLQTETLLITRDGVIVNGNRRLAAMRFLYHKSERVYASFSHVNVAVLPANARESELDLLEARLQMAREFKLKYGWVERRLKLRRQLFDLDIPREDVRETYRASDDEINVELQQLELAEEYLHTFLGMPGAHWELNDKEQMFSDLQKSLKGKKGEDREIRKTLGFLLAKESRNLGDRAYKYKEIFGTAYEDVMNRYAQEKSIPLIGINESVPATRLDPDDPLEGLPIGAPSVFSALKSTLNDPTKSRETADDLVRLAENLREEKKQANDRLSPVKKVQDANKALHDVNVDEVEATLHPQMRGQLESIIMRANELLAKLRDRK